MKAVMIIGFVLLGIVGSAYGDLTDNFESYSLNTWPWPDWIPDASAVTNPANNRIVHDPVDSSNQVLKMYGAVVGFWGAITYNSYSFPTAYIVEARVFNGSEFITGGGHILRATIDMKQGAHWWNPARSLIQFHGNGTILAGDWATVLGTYETERWYDVKIHYQRTGYNRSVQYWLDGAYLGEVTSTIDDLSVEESLDHLLLSVHAGTAYFDDINVYGEPEDPPPTDGPVAYYKLDGTSGAVVDETGNHDGVNHGATRGVAGKVGSAFEFDGSDYVSTDLIPSIYATASLWISPEEDISGSFLGTGGTTDGGKDGWSFAYVVQEVLYTQFWKGNALTGTIFTNTGSVPLGEFSHIAVVVNDTEISAYINGELSGTTTLPSSPDAHDRGLMIGRNFQTGAGANTMRGKIDEVRIYNQALTADEVSELINSPPVALCQVVEVEAGPGCVADASIDNGSYDPDGDTITITQDPPGPYPLGETEVTLTVTDESGASDTCTATVTVEDTISPIIIAAVVEPQIVEIGQTVNYDAVVGDECDPTVEWDFGDGDVSSDIVTTHTYSTADIYTVTLTVTDSSDNSASEEFFVVVYDPDGGFVTGGGWIDSPAGAYRPDPSLAGKANFGFVSKYKKGATTPDGNTEFQFKAGDLNFHSSSYDWLVVTGSNYARFKGKGTINGSGEYKFMLWAGDDTPDTFRIRIWEEDEATGQECVFYDNGMDQEIGGGSIKIHTN
ncbi:LamG-like jellyroll fold domain-containing protein [Planctomycetota bacterium]